MGDTIVRTILLQLQTNYAINSKKRRKDLFCFIVFLHSGHKLLFINSCVPSGKSKSVGFKSFKSFWIIVTSLQSLFLENVTIIRQLFLLRLWYNSVFSSKISAPICKTLHTVFSRSLCSVEVCMPIISTHSLREYWAFLQHWRSRKDTCFTRASFTFLPTSTSDSSPLKLAFKFFAKEDCTFYSHQRSHPKHIHTLFKTAQNTSAI